MKNFKKNLKTSVLLAGLGLFAFATSSDAQTFSGFDQPNLTPVSTVTGEWGLKIVFLNVGQADAILVMTPNGDVVLIDSGKTKTAGNRIVDFLASQSLNGIGHLKTIDLLYTTHYDQDHIGGLPKVGERNVAIRKAYDQGLSTKRQLLTANGNPTAYSKYTTSVGDPNNNMFQDPGESNFVRHRADYGQIESIGIQDEVEIRVLSVRGDTEGTGNDIDRDPTGPSLSFDENPGSIALLIRLGDFEFYTAGDQTDNDWKSKPAIEESLVNAGAIPGGNDIDVLKVNHHGSDTSTSHNFAVELDPEVAIISTKFTGNDRLPKQVTLQQFEDNRTYVLITGDGENPDDGEYTKSSATTTDDSYIPSDEAIFNNQGNVIIIVSFSGDRYTVIGGSFARTFSTNDADNGR